MSATPKEIEAVRDELGRWLMAKPTPVIRAGRSVCYDLDALLIEDNPAMRRMLVEDVAELERAAGR